MKCYYAIGDVHGCAKRLRRLHDQIIEHIQRVGSPGEATVVHLGDYVDRGPDSKGVIDACIDFEKEGKEQGFQTVFLMGNHEDMFLDAYRGSNLGREMYSYLMNGGREAIQSYTGNDSLENWRDSIPQEHIEWIRSLRLDYWADEDKLYFVHAGIDPHTFPDCSDNVKIWTRNHVVDDYVDWEANEALDGVMVVHGHTPNRMLQIEYDEGRRLNLDTGAVYGGKLTCGIIIPGQKPEYIQT